MKISGNFNVAAVEATGIKGIDVKWGGVSGSWDIEFDIRELSSIHEHGLALLGAIRQWSKDELPQTISKVGDAIIAMEDKNRKARMARRLPEARAFMDEQKVLSENELKKLESRISQLTELLAKEEARSERLAAKLAKKEREENPS